MRASRRNAPSLASPFDFWDGFGTRAFSAELPTLLEGPKSAFTTSTPAPGDGDPSFDELQSNSGGLFVPGNFCDRDGDALAIIDSCFPGRRVVGIDCRDVVVGLGTLHCLSQQVPAV